MLKNLFRLSGIKVAFLLTLFISSVYFLDLSFLSLLELKTLDLRFRSRGNIPTSGEVALVTIDEKSLDELGRWPWPRARMAELLNAMGGRVEGAGTRTITIEGVSRLGGASHRTIPDRIETATFAIAGAITGGDVTIRECRPAHLAAVLAKLEEAGIRIETGADCLRVICRGRPRAVNVRTQPFPGFATDMQAQIMTLMAMAEGQSLITESVFENRFMHVNELLRMGADITIAGNTAAVQGVPVLLGAPVMATDLRASASLILAGLAARGTTLISRVYHLDRGYEAIESKLTALGADIQRVKS